MTVMCYEVWHVVTAWQSCTRGALAHYSVKCSFFSK